MAGKRNDLEGHLDSLEDDERIKWAKECVEELTRRIQVVLELHAANEIICYSDALTKQIPDSRAAMAFNVFSESMFSYEIIRLLALWDPPKRNAVSIPMALMIINDPKVIVLLCDETRAAHSTRSVRMLNPSEDTEIQKTIDELVNAHQEEFARSQATKAEIALQACIDTAAEFEGGLLEEGLKNLRDNVAHSVTKTFREKSGKNHMAKYGYERELLEKTIKIVEDLYCWVNGTSFDISGDCFEMARRNAKDLWKNCEFRIPDWRDGGR